MFYPLPMTRGTTYIIGVFDIDLAKFIAALYNHAQPVNMGWLGYEPGDMSTEEAEREIESAYKEIDDLKSDTVRIDYLKGRYMKIDLYMTKEPQADGSLKIIIGWINPAGYDALYGYGKALELAKPFFDNRTRNKLTVQI